MATDWSGFYLGGQLGWGIAETGGADGDGALAGVTGGYRYDFGSFVLGGEAQYDWAEIGGDGETALDNVGRLKAVAGYDAGRALIYGTAGMARGALSGPGGEADETGWVAGAGVDYKLSDRMSLGGEVLHHRFDETDLGGDVKATSVEAKVTFSF